MLVNEGECEGYGVLYCGEQWVFGPLTMNVIFLIGGATTRYHN